MNARSEFVCPLNSAGWGVSEITRRFQTASPALSAPAFSPTRGSGYGSPGDMAVVAGTPLVRAERVPVVAQAAAESNAASENNIFDLVLRTGFMSDSSSASKFPDNGGVGGGLVLLRVDAERHRDQQLLHPRDLGGLVDVDVGGELEDGVVNSGAVGVEQLLHHAHSALVVLDHVFEKQSIEVRAASGIELLHLRVGEH